MHFLLPGTLLTLAWLACFLTHSVLVDSKLDTFSNLSSAVQDLGFVGLDGFSSREILDGAGVGGASTDVCSLACDILDYLLVDLVSSLGSLSYNYQQSKYWSNQQAETRPVCRVQPACAKDVAATLLVTGFLGCPFAVKSGGHASFAGASNIQGGVTIDLKKLRMVQVSPDRTTTQVGAGNRWIDVYNTLTPMNLAVIGGRVADIGVGGLTLGGGISFFSGRYGWACDSVRNYEVVLANGRILNVNAKSYPDLYWALRGGGNNFGVVTRFDLETFEQGNMWGGMALYPVAANTSIFKAFENFANNAPKDPDAALITAFAYAQGQYFASIDLEYAKPIVNPPIFHEFTAIPSLQSTLRIANLTDLTVELNSSNPSGFRETYRTATFKNSAALQGKILDIFTSEVASIKDAGGILPALVMQPITKDMISRFRKNGGNALGIAESDGPLLLTNLAIMWSSTQDDDRVLAAAKRIIDRSVATAKEMRLDYKYIYQNYASLDQDVFASYGLENKNRLIQISRKYDPRRVFQILQPGYFKLDGNNGGSMT